MDAKKSLGTKLGGLAAATFVKTWMGTLDFQGAMYDTTVDPARDDFCGPIIGLVWHEYLMSPIFLRGRNNSALLTSRHRDAEWLAEAARHLGFTTFRGSTARGGTQALLELLRTKGTQNVGIAADGPLGPRRTLAPGPIYLSSKLQIPLIAFGFGYDRPWRLSTWDRFALPRPGSRARMILGPRVQIPADVTRGQLEYYRRRMEALLDRLTREAEAWAEARSRKVNQMPIFPRVGGGRQCFREQLPARPRRAA
jgi:lysophospholipid acyltransferase (LPLAT)-like uncharacterized protein